MRARNPSQKPHCVQWWHECNPSTCDSPSELRKFQASLHLKPSLNKRTKGKRNPLRPAYDLAWGLLRPMILKKKNWKIVLCYLRYSGGSCDFLSKRKNCRTQKSAYRDWGTGVKSTGCSSRPEFKSQHLRDGSQACVTPPLHEIPPLLK